jgi:hypothetical protein
MHDLQARIVRFHGNTSWAELSDRWLVPAAIRGSTKRWRVCFENGAFSEVLSQGCWAETANDIVPDIEAAPEKALM